MNKLMSFLSLSIICMGTCSCNDARHTAITQGVNMPNGAVAGQVNLDAYDKFGYMPVEKGVISKTLDYAYDDYCAGTLAIVLGKKLTQPRIPFSSIVKGGELVLEMGDKANKK